MSLIYLDSTVDRCVDCGGEIAAEPSVGEGPFWEDCTCVECGHKWTQPRPQDDDFLIALEGFQRDLDAPKERVMQDAPAKKKVELNVEQKKAILRYVMTYSKGLAEDCDPLWEGMKTDEIDENYDAVTNAAEEFITESLNEMLTKLDAGPHDERDE